MARDMRAFNNCSLTAGKITLSLKDSKTRYHATGWVTVNSRGDLEIYGEDQRRLKPLMVVPSDNVGNVDVDLLG